MKSRYWFLRDTRSSFSYEKLVNKVFNWFIILPLPAQPPDTNMRTNCFVQYSPNYQKYVNFKRDECRMPLAPTLYRAAPLHEGVVPLIQTEWQRKSLLNRQWSIVLTSPRRRVYFHKAFA